jgi:hypothetical protein
MAGGAGLAGGGLGWLMGKKEKKDPYGTLNPEQIAVNKALGPRLQALAGAPVYYGDQLTEPITSAEAANVEQFGGMLPGSYSTLRDLGTYDDLAFQNQFREEIASPAYQEFRQYAQPALEEAVPTSGSARAALVREGIGNLSRDLLTQRFSAREAAKNRALSATLGTPGFAAGAAGVLAIPRGIKQAGLDRKYQEYVRANEQNRKDIDAALRFLGISTGTYQPDTRGQMALQGAMSGASLALGGMNAYNANQQNQAMIDAYNKRTDVLYK